MYVCYCPSQSFRSARVQNNIRKKLGYKMFIGGEKCAGSVEITKEGVSVEQPKDGGVLSYIIYGKDMASGARTLVYGRETMAGTLPPESYIV